MVLVHNTLNYFKVHNLIFYLPLFNNILYGKWWPLLWMCWLRYNHQISVFPAKSVMRSQVWHLYGESVVFKYFDSSVFFLCCLHLCLRLITWGPTKTSQIGQSSKIIFCIFAICSETSHALLWNCLIPSYSLRLVNEQSVFFLRSIKNYVKSLSLIGEIFNKKINKMNIIDLAK